MPKDTFLNLPEEKRAHIERVAMEEFAEYGYDNASINRIVEGAGIAKGSFYQYFTDKQDVLAHLMSTTAQAKLAYISPVLQNPAAHDFFTIMRELWRSGLEFARAHPIAAKVGNQFLLYRSHPVYKTLYEQNIQAGKAFYRDLIERGIAQGDIRSDINIDFTIHMLINMSVSMIEYYFEEVRGDEMDMSQIGDDVMDTLSVYLEFVQYGIASPQVGETLGKTKGAQQHD